MTENEISGKILELAFKIHTALGPGLLESPYKECLHYSISKAGLWVEKEKPIPLVYEQIHMDCGYRCDLIVENCVIVEVKSVESICDLHKAQLLTYLKITGMKVGLLLNFNTVHLKDGVKRMVNGL
jgi:GxxExxY protein